MSRMIPPSGQDPSLMGVSPTSYPFPLSENSTTPSLIQTNHKYRRLEIPIFMGENLDEWLSRAECFFDLHKIIWSRADRGSHDRLRGKMRYSGTSGRTKDKQSSLRENCEVFCWSNARRPWRKFTWTMDGFKEGEHHCWVSSKGHSLAAGLEDVTEICIVNKFENRLPPKIQRELRVLRPSGLGQAMELVQMLEETLTLISYKAKASRITSIQTNWKSQISAAKEGPPSCTTTPMRNPMDGIRFEVCQQILSSNKNDRRSLLSVQWEILVGYWCKRKELNVLVVQEEVIEKE